MKTITVIAATFLLTGCAYKSVTVNVKDLKDSDVRIVRPDSKIPAASTLEDLGKHAGELKKLIQVDPVSLISGKPKAAKVGPKFRTNPLQFWRQKAPENVTSPNFEELVNEAETGAEDTSDE